MKFFAYSFWDPGQNLKNLLPNLVIEFSVDLVSIDAQMMFKHALDHLSLDPGLPWMFVKSEKTKTFWGMGIAL